MENVLTNDENPIVKIKEKNHLLFLFEIAASILIIFIHCRFPGTVGSLLEYTARFGVPLFFIVSGFFLFSSDESRTVGELRKKIKRRLIRLLILLLISFVCYFTLNLIFHRSDLRGWFTSLFSPSQVAYLLIFNKPMLSEPNWFLLALIYSYVVILIFPKVFISKKGSIIVSLISVLTIMIHLVMYQFSPYLFNIRLSSLLFYRNWLMFALPCVSIGIVLRNNINRLVNIKTIYIVVLLILSAILMVVELYCYAKFLHAEIEFGVFNLVFLYRNHYLY